MHACVRMRAGVIAPRHPQSRRAAARARLAAAGGAPQEAAAGAGAAEEGRKDGGRLESRWRESAFWSGVWGGSVTLSPRGPAGPGGPGGPGGATWIMTCRRRHRQPSLIRALDCLCRGGY